MRKIKRIYIHHTATPRETTTFEWVDDFHRQKGWGGIGYHYFIDGRGSVYKGRPESEVGVHAKWDNQTSIGVCVAGNFEKETPTDAQMETLAALLKTLSRRYQIRLHNIIGHRDRARIKWWRIGVWFNRTLCPGKHLYEKLVVLRNQIASI